MSTGIDRFLELGALLLLNLKGLESGRDSLPFKNVLSFYQAPVVALCAVVNIYLLQTVLHVGSITLES